MDTKNLKSMLIAFGAAIIWGVAFVAQSDSSAPTFMFNAARSWVAVPFLLLVILLFTKWDLKHWLWEEDREATRTLWTGGTLMGVALFAATFMQQHGMDLGTVSGKAGFITALYMILVPIGGLVLGKKTGINVWIAAVIAVAGLYLICIGDDFSIQTSDLYVLGCAFCFMVQILLIDRFAVKCNCIKLSCVQFITCAVLSTAASLIFERGSLPEIDSILSANARPILYLGVFSSGIAYTMQMLAQKGSNPTAVSIIMSMESVFSVLAAWIIKNETLSVKAYIGCGLMFIAVLFTQFDFLFVPSKKER